MSHPRDTRTHLDAIRPTGNQTRAGRLELRTALRDGTVAFVDVMRNPPACILRLRGFEVVRLLPQVGEAKAERMLDDLARRQINVAKRIGSMTARERAALVWYVRTTEGLQMRLPELGKSVAVSALTPHNTE